MVSGADLDLFVAGVQPAATDRAKAFELISKTREVKKDVALKPRPSPAPPAKVDKINQEVDKNTTEPTTSTWEASSNGSELSSQDADVKPPVFWVDITKKLTAPKKLDRRNPSLFSTPRTSSSSFPAPVLLVDLVPSLLPEGFRKFIQQKLQLISEVQNAKYRRSLNRQITWRPEENANWTSHAPRPTQSKLVKAKKKRKGVKIKDRSLSIHNGLQGIQLEGTSVRLDESKEAVQQLAARAKRKKKKSARRKQHDHFWPNDDTQKRVSFLLPTEKKKVFCYCLVHIRMRFIQIPIRIIHKFWVI